MIYPEDFINKVIQGDCLEVMKKLPDKSIDLVCTDPPYGYSFMGKDWDNFKATRNTKSQVVTNLGAGMKKTTVKANVNYQQWVTEWASEALRVAKPGAFMFYCMAPRSDLLSRAVIGLEDAGWDVGFTPIYWTYASGFPKAMNIGKMVDKRMGVERDVSGTRKSAGGRSGGNNEFGVALASIPKTVDITAPATDEAKALDGSYGGFQPKPAVEVIIVAMKPLSEKTYVDQALKNGKGITWLDDCRVPFQSDTDKSKVLDPVDGTKGYEHTAGAMTGGIKRMDVGNPHGRFPANLLVSDDVLNDGTVTGEPKRTEQVNKGFWGAEGSFTGVRGHGDSGSYSRYFDLDKWASTLPFLIVPKASKREKNKGLEDREKVTVSDGPPIAIDNAFQRGKTERVNSHPTVKPLKLMSYLITLGSRPGDLILDPFCGSGTTCLAAKELGREYISIEREEEYVKIAEERLRQDSLL